MNVRTQEELQIVNAVEQEYRAKGLRDSKHNIDWVQANAENFFGNTPVTAEGIRNFIETLRPHLEWKSEIEMRYETLLNALTPEQRAQFEGWFFSQSKTLMLSGPNDEGFINGAEILEWCKNKPFVPEIFNQAVSNLARTSKVGLRWAARPETQTTSRFHNHNLDKDPGNKPADSVFVNGRRDHSKDKTANVSKPAALTDDARWWQMANNLEGHTHAKTAQAMAIVKEDGRSTYEARKRFIEGRGATL